MSNRVLVVDDVPVLCELIHDVLTSAEIEPVPISNSAQASALLREEKFDAVFLDIRMPAPDGLELARQIRASGLNQTTPIVMITSEEDRTVLTRAFQAGANFLLFKSIDPHRLLRLIRVTEGVIQREARQYQRVRVGCKVSMQSSQEQSFGKTLDLSLNGAMIQAEGRLFSRVSRPSGVGTHTWEVRITCSRARWSHRWQRLHGPSLPNWSDQKGPIVARAGFFVP